MLTDEDKRLTDERDDDHDDCDEHGDDDKAITFSG